ncbi:MAG: hypothetical protein LUF33_08910, partial [Clostridiales bacterium]|nr:hypothetical protein [Clostridiales bacterium]
ALCYYNSDYHGWSDIDTYFTPQADGTYALEYVTTNSENISCNVYDTSAQTYNCVASSTPFYYADGTTDSFTLTASESRGKSITIYDLEAGSVLRFVYDPSDNTLDISCEGADETYAFCYYNDAYHGWSDIDTFLVKQSDGTYALEFTTTNAENISCNIYDNSSATYNCVAASTPLYYSDGTTTDYELTASESRGKSITIYDLDVDYTIKLVYNPTDNTLSITCGTSSASAEAVE